MKKKLLAVLITLSSLYGNWAVQDCDGKNQITLEPSGDFNISVGNLQVPEGNFSVMKGNGKFGGNFSAGGSASIGGNFAAGGNADIGGNLQIGGDLTIGGSLVVSAPLPHLDINSTTVTEGDDAVLSIKLLDRDQNEVDASADIEIHYKTINGGALAGQDYDGVSDDTVTLKKDNSSVNITIKTTDDDQSENNRTETVFVKIWLEGTNNDYASACCAQMGVIGITDNDGSNGSSGGGSDDDDDDGDSGGGNGWF